MRFIKNWLMGIAYTIAALTVGWLVTMILWFMLGHPQFFLICMLVGCGLVYAIGESNAEL